MQFVRNGPDVPERLLQAHEEGRVVLFCGAGVSFPASLPGFDELVKRIYDDLHVTPDRMQNEAIKAKRFDTAIGLLESGIVDGRPVVRRKLAELLTPDLGAPNATATHEALVTLGRNQDGRTRLVTTNFDRLFEEVITNKRLDVERHQAPLLPVPKNRWTGLVYLHGLLPNNPGDENLDHLIVSSGDFGLAYLTERWAARFVGELFRNFTVCFVGYSINDPVLRYMTDALAADRLMGESPAEMFAFGSHSKGDKDDRAEEWTAKNVTPILYREHKRHWYLHKTLRVWADTHRDGIRGNESIVVRYAGSRPVANTKQDDFVGRMMWVLSDPSGLPAKRFADLNPVPSLDWLESFSEDRYEQADLSRFGIPIRADKDGAPAFSLIRRPSPHTHAPWMSLVGGAPSDSDWDKVMRHLAHWLTRHLDDPALGLWLVKNGGRIQREFAELIERRMDYLDRLEQESNWDELNRIRASAPRAIPRPLMRTLWQLLLSGRVKSSVPTYDMFRWVRWFKRDGLTATLRLQLREILTPRVSLNEPIRWTEDQGDSDRSEQLEDLVGWQIVLSSDYVRSRLRDLSGSRRWTEALPSLLDDFSMLLLDAMELMRELGKTDDKYDPSLTWLPSISAHPQNKHSRDWTVLIELTRDAWLETAKVSPEHTRLVAEAWVLLPYPLFRRLAYFAAAQKGIIPTRKGLRWLLADDHWWLWASATHREAIRLLVALAPMLDAKLLVELEQAVLAGPPRKMYRPDLDPERFTGIVERGVWLRLKKLEDAGATLTNVAKAKLNKLTLRHSDWDFKAEEHEEFPIWFGRGSEFHDFVATPRHRRELADWLKLHPKRDLWQRDDWLWRCINDFRTTAWALSALAKENQWPVERWREALQAWSDEKLTKCSWQFVGPVLIGAPDTELLRLAPAVGWWLGHVAKTLDGYDPQFLEFCKCMLELDHDVDEDEDDPVDQAINHPVGRITEALLFLWTETSLADGQGLAPEIRPIFTKLCNMGIRKFRHGRVSLSMRVVTLFRVDPDWTVHHLLPLFNWKRSQSEARAAWEGFFCSPRLYRPLMEVIMGPFLDTASNYEKLGRHGKHYPAWLTFAALDLGDIFTKTQLQIATGALPESGLQRVTDALADALKGAGRQRAEHWQNRTRPYLQKTWPKSIERRTPAISDGLARVCIAAQDAFPDALEELRRWLQPPQYPGLLMHQLKESELCRKFPESSLVFLDLVINKKNPALWNLKDCLKQIQDGEPRLDNDSRFRGLRELLELGGQGL